MGTTTLSDLIDPATQERLRAAAGMDPKGGLAAAAVASSRVDAVVEQVDSGVEFKDESAAPGSELEHKSADLKDGGAQVIDVDEETGLVTALVAVTGVEDKVKDTIEPGAFVETLKSHEPIGVWSHDDKVWVSRTEDAVELFPGDPFFRGIKTMDGKPWPKEAGAVKVETKFNLETPHGAAAFSDVKFFQGKTGWSIGYRATKAQRNVRTGQRSIKALNLFEYSPVMVGAASQPLTLAVKSAAGAVDPESDLGIADLELIESLSDEELKGWAAARESVGLDVETKGMPAWLDTKARVRTAAGQQRYGQPIGSVIVADIIPSGPIDDAGLAKLRAAAKDDAERALIDRAKPLAPATRRTFLESGGQRGKQVGAPGMIRGFGKAPAAAKPAPSKHKDGRDNYWAGYARGITNMPEKDRNELRSIFDKALDGGASPTDALEKVRDRQDQMDDTATRDKFGGAENYWKGFAKGLPESVDQAKIRAAYDAGWKAQGPKEALRRARAALSAQTSTRKSMLQTLNRRVTALGFDGVEAMPMQLKGVDLAELTDDELVAHLDADPGVELKGSRASLDRSPRANWVENTGELPGYIREVARAIERDHGYPLSRAIPMAIGRIKRWARGEGDVTAATRAKAAAAVEAWELLKKKAHAKSDAELWSSMETKTLQLMSDVQLAWETLAAAGELDLKALVEAADLIEAPAEEPTVDDGLRDIDLDDLVEEPAAPAVAAAEAKAMLERARELKGWATSVEVPDPR